MLSSVFKDVDADVFAPLEEKYAGSWKRKVVAEVKDRLRLWWFDR